MKKNFNKILIIFYFLFIFLVLNNSAISQSKVEILKDYYTVEAKVNDEITNTDTVYTNDEIDKETKRKSHFPENPEKYIPMPIPVWKPPKEISDTDNKVVSFNPTTGAEHISDIIYFKEFDADFVKGNLGNIMNETFMNSEDNNQGLRNFTDLGIVDNPEDYPWRVNCKLYMTFGGTHHYVASGVLIDPMHVLTAGHCVYDNENGYGWADSICVVPGYEFFNRPYGDASAVQLHSWSGWTNNANYDYDMGVIDLDRPIGSMTGWHGYGYNNNSFFENNTFHNPGYPAESPYNGQYMYYWYGTYDDVSTYLLYFNKYCYGGQSGSGSYFIDNSNRIVYAELSHRQWLFGWKTGQVRITSNKFSGIQTIIYDDTPSSFDLIPLDVNTEPVTIQAGNQLTSTDYYVHNYSSASWSGTVPVTVYLSTNDNISQSDTPIQNHSFTHSFGPKSSVRVNVSTPPTIPINTTAGDYYIGIILDISDYNTDNNDTDGQDASFITVTYASPIADFVGNPTSGQAPLTVWFTDQSSGIIDSWSWSFSEGNPSSASGQGPHQVIYNNPDSYDVSLTVSGPGGSDTETKYDYITVTAPQPIADFVGNPTSGQTPLTVWFTDQSSGIIDSWSWSFPESNPSSASGQGPHQVIYNNPDSYDVSLTVSGPGGSDTETKYDYITVTAPQPIADFVGNPTSGQTPLTVWFTDQSSGIIDSWSWSFPGGNPSLVMGQGPHQVIYNNPDSYDVSLIVSGPGGSDTEAKYDYITVSNPDFPPPENLVAGDDFNGYVPLDWNPPSSRLRDPLCEGYKIYRSLTSGSGYNQIYQINNPSTTNYEDSNVINGTTYYYVVTAIYSNPTGESVYSNEANGTPQGRYLISGYIRDNDYIPIDYVLITLSGYVGDTEYTDENGYYEFTNLVGGKYYLITPSKNGWIFEPVSIEFDPLENNQNNQDFIGTSDITFYNIDGYVSYCISGLPVGDVVLDISGNISGSEITNSNGYYSFSDLPEGGNYLVVPDKEDDISINCISAMDAAWVLKYSIGLIEFLECQIAAADVTGNGSVSAMDAAKILKYSIGLINQFPVGKDWCFLPESCYYQNLQQDFLNENYTGVVYGDVTHNWSPSLVMEDEDTEYNGIISLNNVTGNPGEVVNVPINLQYAEDVISARIMLTYNSTLVTFQEVNLTSLTEGFLMYSNNLSEEVRIAFAGLYPIEEGGDILELKFEINEFAQVGNSTLLQFVEVWINEAQSANTIDGEIVISSKSGITDGSLNCYILNCYPNPFNSTTSINFQLSKENQVEIRIFNIQGQLVDVILNNRMKAGKHQVSWDASNMASGLYFYQITAGNRVFTKKVLLLR